MGGMNVSDIMARRAQQAPRRPAFLKGDWGMSNAQAEAAVEHVASILHGHGLRAGDLVGLSAKVNPVASVLAILGLARLGAILVPVLPSTNEEKRSVIAEHFKLAAIITGASDPGAGAAPRIVVDAGWLKPGAVKKAVPRHAGGEHTWIITLTSGTTGAPKGVPRTHESFLKVSRLQNSLARLKPDARFLSFMDMHNGPAIKRTLRHLSAGGPVVFLDRKFPGSKLPIDEHRVTHIYASPAMMQKWLEVRPRGRPVFRTVQQLVVGTGAVPPELGREIVERITPHLYLNYGTTETGSAALLDPQTRERYPEATGRIVPWVEAEIVDENDQPLPAGQPGMIRFRGEGVARGYWGVESGQASEQRGFRNGWFYPGDAARIEAGGLLYVQGRIDDIINLDGPKVNALEVEGILARHPDVREAAVFGARASDGQMCFVAAVAVRGAFDAPALVRHYAEQGGKYRQQLRVVQVDALPRSGAGKVVKHELKQKTGF
jgi:acyl-CoA synthetase (AMP-forming)/AMP-acid ligase II